MDTIILLPQENLFAQDTSVVPLNQNLLRATGRAKNSGLDLGDLQKVHLKIGKENISIFVFII